VLLLLWRALRCVLRGVLGVIGFAVRRAAHAYARRAEAQDRAAQPPRRYERARLRSDAAPRAASPAPLAMPRARYVASAPLSGWRASYAR
jgi:hypothetical protein